MGREALVQAGHLGTALGQWAEHLDGMLSKEVAVGRQTQPSSCSRRLLISEGSLGELCHVFPAPHCW